MRHLCDTYLTMETADKALAKELERLQEIEYLQMQKLAAEEAEMSKLQSMLVHEHGFTSSMLAELEKQADAHVQSVMQSQNSTLT